jgi:hypothetical protein
MLKIVLAALSIFILLILWTKVQRWVAASASNDDANPDCKRHGHCLFCICRHNAPHEEA